MVTKAEIVQRIAEDMHMPTAKVGRIFDEVFRHVTESLESGEDVKIPKLGVFRIVKKNRKLYDFDKDEASIQKIRTVVFRPAKLLKSNILKGFYR